MTTVLGGSYASHQLDLISLVTSFDGASLLNRGLELREFIARGVDDPERELVDDHKDSRTGQMKRISTCGLFALAVWHTLRVKHELVDEPYKMGMAIAWATKIAWELKAVRYPKKNGAPSAGSLLHYHTPGRNDDHVEFVLSHVLEHEDGRWLASHGGGGREHCGVSVVAESDIKWSSGRPLQCWYDWDAMASERSAYTF